jgi:transcription antitermination factor NusG
MSAAESGITNVAVADSAWYALYTRHQHEKTVARLLSSKGFEIFLPLYTTAHRWKDRTKQLSLPLFPCYVFLRGDTRRRVDILGTPGVHSLVGSEGRPAPISQSEVDAIRQMVESRMQVEPHPFLRCGDWIRVKSGPLAGIEGILVRKKNLFRLVVSVELLQKSVGVEVDVTTVERAARPAWAGAAGTPHRALPAFL